MCPYLVGGCEFERSSDTWKLPTMAPAALRGEIEMVFKKKKKISSSSCRPTGQEGRAGIMERDREGRWRLCWGCNRGRSSKDAIRDQATTMQPGSLQASPTAPSIPHTALQNIPLQTQFFTSGFRANKYTFSLRLEETTVISLGMAFHRGGEIHSTSRQASGWPFQHLLQKHKWTL